MKPVWLCLFFLPILAVGQTAVATDTSKIRCIVIGAQSQQPIEGALCVLSQFTDRWHIIDTSYTDARGLATFDRSYQPNSRINVRAQGYSESFVFLRTPGTKTVALELPPSEEEDAVFTGIDPKSYKIAATEPVEIATPSGYPDIDAFIAVEKNPEPINITDFMAQIGYPEDLRAANLTGRVAARILVDKDGTVVDYKVLRSPHTSFTKLVTNNLKTLRFTPAIQAGRPIACWANVSFKFLAPTPAPAKN